MRGRRPVAVGPALVTLRPKARRRGVAYQPLSPSCCAWAFTSLSYKRSTGLGLGDSGADLDQDLLQVRALDRRDELEREARLLVVLVLQLVSDQGRSVARDLAGADRERTGSGARLRSARRSRRAS